MEEVDRIIIDSLRHLKCDIDEEITTLKHFSPDIVVTAISACLETMNPLVKLPKKLPPSMSARIKFASNLAQQIKELGFKGDMGYQTLLYCNEVEVRRVLMFLIERLPKESSPISIEPTGYVPRIVKKIEDSMKQSLSRMWLPSEVLNYGVRNTESGFIVNSFGHSCPVDSVPLVTPENSTSAEEHAYIPIITQQCSSRQLLPSLLYQHKSEGFNNKNLRDKVLKAAVTKDISKEILQSISSSKSPKEIVKIQASKEPSLEDKADSNIQKNRVEELVDILSQKRDTFVNLQGLIGASEEKLEKLKCHREEEQKFLKDSVAKVKVKNKTLAVLSNEDNKIKLRNLIQKTENRLVELSNQWAEVQKPLLEEHKSLKSSVSTGSLKLQTERNKLLTFKKTYKEMVADFKEKCTIEQTLIERCKELNNKSNRAAYTKRILEIVGNIKKQNKEIQKILSDTRQVQKDINNLTGQVDRSFTLSDELIFQDCKHEEAARKAYKLLAALREECNGILQGVSDMGQAERELRNLDEQVELEKNKDTKDKLDKVQRDLAEIRKEMQMII